MANTDQQGTPAGRGQWPTPISRAHRQAGASHRRRPAGQTQSVANTPHTSVARARPRPRARARASTSASAVCSPRFLVAPAHAHAQQKCAHRLSSSHRSGVGPPRSAPPESPSPEPHAPALMAMPSSPVEISLCSIMTSRELSGSTPSLFGAYLQTHRHPSNKANGAS